MSRQGFVFVLLYQLHGWSFLSTSKVLIASMLLVSWLQPHAQTNCPDLLQDSSRNWDIVDLFAGAGRIARLSRKVGMKACAMDIGYHTNKRVFDLNESPGFVLLAFELYTGVSIEFFMFGPPVVTSNYLT